MNQRIACALILLTAVIITVWTPVHPMPLDNEYVDNNSGEYNSDLDEKTKEHLRQCDMNLETMELCMRCAKITKSTFVYPLCCGNEDSIKDWCHSYVFFGISE